MPQQHVTPPGTFEPPCPACGEPRGRPLSVEARAKERVVTFVCAKCNHQWAMTTDAPDDILFGEPPG